MLTIELKMLPGEANAATKFLQSKLQADIRVRGKEIEIDNEKADEVKLLLKKFLHQEGLTGYRVLSESGVLRIVLDERQQPYPDAVEDDKIKGVPPFPPLSGERLPLMQTVYPNYGSGSSLPPPIYKRARKQKSASH